MTRDGVHLARHYVRFHGGKPSQRTLSYANPSFPGAPGCGWDNLKRYAFLRGFELPPPASACARRYHRARDELDAHLNASSCCDALGADAPHGHFGHDSVPVW